MTAEPSDAPGPRAAHRGRLFERQQTVGPGDVDARGEAHLDALARWIQDVAFADLLDAELPEQTTWVVRRTAIRIERRPRYTERLQLSTHCSGLAKSVAERRTTITGDQGARVETTAHWVQVDPETRMPTRFSAEFVALYGESAGGRRARSRLRHPAPPEDAQRDEWRFRAADIDLAGHVNNTVYWQLAEQYLGEANEIEIEFRAGAGAGPATVLHSRGRLWILDREGSVAASIEAAGQAAPAAGESAKIRQ